MQTLSLFGYDSHYDNHMRVSFERSDPTDEFSFVSLYQSFDENRTVYYNKSTTKLQYRVQIVNLAPLVNGTLDLAA